MEDIEPPPPKLEPMPVRMTTEVIIQRVSAFRTKRLVGMGSICMVKNASGELVVRMPKSVFNAGLSEGDIQEILRVTFFYHSAFNILIRKGNPDGLEYFIPANAKPVHFYKTPQ